MEARQRQQGAWKQLLRPCDASCPATRTPCSSWDGRSVGARREGATCEIFKGSLRGDDYHFSLIDPDAPRAHGHGVRSGHRRLSQFRESWSSWYNQPTGQFYHLATDNRFPYRIYAGQQDNGTVSIASRSDYGAITFRDWRVRSEPTSATTTSPIRAIPTSSTALALGGRLSRWERKKRRGPEHLPVARLDLRRAADDRPVPLHVDHPDRRIEPAAVPALPRGAGVISLDRSGGALTAISLDAAARARRRKIAAATRMPRGREPAVTV